MALGEVGRHRAAEDHRLAPEPREAVDTRNPVASFHIIRAGLSGSSNPYGDLAADTLPATPQREEFSVWWDYANPEFLADLRKSADIDLERVWEVGSEDIKRILQHIVDHPLATMFALALGTAASAALGPQGPVIVSALANAGTLTLALRKFQEWIAQVRDSRGHEGKIRASQQPLIEGLLLVASALIGLPLLRRLARSEEAGGQLALRQPGQEFLPATTARTTVVGSELISPDPSNGTTHSVVPLTSPSLDPGGRTTAPKFSSDVVSYDAVLASIRHHPTVMQLLNNPALAALRYSGSEADLRAVFDIIIRPLKGNIVVWSGDTEGLINSDYALLKRLGFIRRNADGSMELDPSIPDLRFAHTGDIAGDRGPTGFLDAYEKTLLHDRVPLRDTAVWGNHENKFLIHQALREIDSGIGPLANAYRAYRELHPGPDTLPARMNFWLSTKGGAPLALRFHREALADIVQKLKRGELNPTDAERLKVYPGMSLDEEAVAQHYLEAWKRGGVYFEYMRRFNLVGDDRVLGHEHALTHGGVSRDSISSVPFHRTPPKDMNQFLTWYSELGLRGFREMEEAIDRELPVPEWFATLMNSKFQTSTSENRSQPIGPVYPEQSREDGNYRLPTEDVAEFARRAGRFVLHQGHGPQAGTAKAMEAPTEPHQAPLTYFWHDSSYSEEPQNISATVGTTAVVIARTGRGEVMVALNEQGPRAPFGMITEIDGFHVDGLIIVGPNREMFRLSKYEADGITPVFRYVTAEQLEQLQPRSRYSRASHAVGFARGFVEALQRREEFAATKAITAEDLASRIPEGAISVLGSSKFVEVDPNHPAESVQQMLQNGFSNLVTVMGAKRRAAGAELTLLHSGAAEVATVHHNGGLLNLATPEMLMMREMVAHNTGTGMAVVPPNCDPDEVLRGPGKNSVALITTAGKHRIDWGATGTFISEQVHQKGGVQIFAGGGLSLEKVIEASIARSTALIAAGHKPALVILLDHHDHSGGVMTASAKMARRPNLPSNFVTVTLEQFSHLGELVSSLETQYRNWSPASGQAFTPHLKVQAR